MVPLAYCETNFVVAYAFPHHEHHGRATSLLLAAKGGACELRIPYAAFLEAKTPIREQNNALTKALSTVKDACTYAHANGEPGFADTIEFLEKMALNEYLRRPAPDVIEHLLLDPSVVKLRNVEDACAKLDELRRRLNFTGKDVVDLYLLAAVVADRDAEPRERPVILLRLSSHDSPPSGFGNSCFSASFAMHLRVCSLFGRIPHPQRCTLMGVV